MEKGSSIKVKSVRKYKKPINPFSYNVINLLVGVVILVVGVFFMSSCGSAEGKGNSLKFPFITQEIGNPFTFDDMGFPYIPSFCGTGRPSRLNAEDAHEVIKMVFAEEGLNLKEDYLYEKEGVKVLLNGFDEASQIGYVWVGYKQMGLGMKEGSRSVYSENLYSDLTKNPFDIYEKEGLKALNRILKNKTKVYIKDVEKIEKFEKRLNQIESIKLKRKKLKAFEVLSIDISIARFEGFKEELIQRYLVQHTVGDRLKDKLIHLKHLKLLNSIEKFSTDKYGNRAFDGSIIDRNEAGIAMGLQILELDDEQLKSDEFNTLACFMKIYKNIKNYSRSPFKEKAESILLLKDRQGFYEAAKQFIYDYDGDRLSLPEARKIEGLADTKGDFIAPIGYRDERMKYPYYRISKEEEIKLKEILENEGRKEYNEAQRKILVIAREKAKQEILKNLEIQVRQYIHWAKQQQGY